MCFDLFDDKMYLIFHLLLRMQNLMPLLLVDQVVIDIGAPNGSIGRHQSHQVNPIFHYHLNKYLELQLSRAHFLPRVIDLHIQKIQI